MLIAKTITLKERCGASAATCARKAGILDHLVEGAPQLAEIYGFQVAPEETGTTLADYFASELKHPPKQGEVLQLGPIALVAYRVADERVTSVGLRLPEEEVACWLVSDDAGATPTRARRHQARCPHRT
jgi:hypothetical protein